MSRVLIIEPNEIIWKEKKPILGKEASMLLLRIGAIKFGDFTLSSKRKSPYYIDLRLAPSYPDVLDRIGDLYVGVVKNEIQHSWKIDRIAGVPTAGLPVATVVSQKMRIPLIYVRKERKNYGLSKNVEGIVKTNDNILLVDDLVTTGRSTIEEAGILRDTGNVKHVVVLVDREQGGLENLSRNDLQLHSLIKITDVFAYLRELDAISAKTYETVMNYVKSSEKASSKVVVFRES